MSLFFVSRIDHLIWIQAGSNWLPTTTSKRSPHTMILLRSCLDWIQKCFAWSHCDHHNRKNKDEDHIPIVDEHTPLERGTARTAPLVVHNPPTHKRGFSLGFVSFFDSSEGIAFGLCNLMLYYLAAVIAFSFLWEKWTIIDSVYFATVTFTSVGEL